MSDLIRDITADLQSQIDTFKPDFGIKDVGSVIEAGDGIARAQGLANVRSQELVQFANGVKGIAFNLERDNVGIIIMGEYSEIEEGMEVRSTGRIASVPVGEGLIGRVVNALGEPVDGKGIIKFDHYRPMERIAPGVIARKDVDTPVQTGLKAIDAMIPIGRGQRELIIGDRQTGKTALAIDTIINQKGKDLFCIYVAIGQKKAAIARTVAILERFGAMDYTIVVSAGSSDPAPLQYIAPYSGCAMAEFFMYNKGKHTLCIYDDLSKQAQAYRQLSLLLRRPPGREAYPGDVFYLHSRLLERSCKLAERRAVVPAGQSYKEGGANGKTYIGVPGKHEAEHDAKAMAGHEVAVDPTSGGSLTALPVIETLEGEVSAYIPTNVISITDGQIYLEPDLFFAGVRPAINVGISVSRVGGNAQIKAMKKIAGSLRLDLASFRELEAFAQLGTELDAATQRQLDRGARMVELLKQGQFKPFHVTDQVISIFAGSRGFLDDLPITRVAEFEEKLLKHILDEFPEVRKTLNEKMELTSDIEARLKDIIANFKARFAPATAKETTAAQ